MSSGASASSFELPGAYRALLESALGAPRDEPQVWLGDVGLIVPASFGELDAWPGRLASKRWPAMHPELVPFAVDGYGNRYCFVNPIDPEAQRPGAVVHWMYETYRATPIATDFEAFIDWMGLTSALASRSHDAVGGEAGDHENRVVPLLRAAGAQADWGAALEAMAERDLPIHAAMTALHPGSPGSSVVLAAREAALGRIFSAVDLCEEAATAFRPFTAAHIGIARALDDGTDGERHFEALFEAAHLPLMYGGDEFTPHFMDVPRIDATALFDALAVHPRGNSRIDDDPLWDLIQADDPCVAEAWLRCAGECARAGALTQAATLVCNALFVSVTDEDSRNIMDLLAELFDAMGSPWHAEMARLDADVRDRAARKR